MTGPSTVDGEAEHASPAIAAPYTGSRLGRYTLLFPLAEGGMGVVYAGRLTGAHGVQRVVAIKTLRPMTSARDRTALLHEAQLTVRLHHRNVVATLDLGQVDDVPYVIMELVAGVSLARLLDATLREGERLAPPLAMWIVMQVALGLHAAHELADAAGEPLGLVHRDVSPQNILLSTSGEVKIADFGIAKYAGRDEATATGMIKGKFAYMSPEQTQSVDLDRRSDVFALGTVLWEALTGEKLFAAATPARTILRVVQEAARSPAKVRPEIGDELAAIVLRCLEKEPAKRWATAMDLADALRGALRSQGAHVDEADLAVIVTRHFGAECARLVERAATSTAEPSPSPRTSRAAIVVGVTAVLLGAGAWALVGRPPAPASAPPITTIAAVTVAHDVDAAPIAALPIATPPVESASPPVIARPRIVHSAAAPPSPPPAPAASPTSVAGHPFESL